MEKQETDVKKLQPHEIHNSEFVSKLMGECWGDLRLVCGILHENIRFFLLQPPHLHTSSRHHKLAITSSSANSFDLWFRNEKLKNSTLQ
jgi:hypothetical protein